MKRQQVFKFQRKPKQNISVVMRHTAGFCRFVWNKILEKEKNQFSSGRKYFGPQTAL
ncbi:MAG: helix-turn-helix domain-containing protein [Desulfovibrio sp.]|nr:helix-turn-helix domain-containing protein [Desulfovibrio sp.]